MKAEVERILPTDISFDSQIFLLGAAQITKLSPGQKDMLNVLLLIAKKIFNYNKLEEGGDTDHDTVDPKTTSWRST